ncbi:MAG: inositol monophosphatase family protein [Archaeoglobaceae archaeon]
MTPKEALEISRKVTEEVKNSVSRIPYQKLSSEVGMGKDGTPTKKVDKVAENAAINILKEYDVTVVSEEAGVVGEGDTYVALDPIDGTFNAGRNIPLYAVSLCFSTSYRIADTFAGYVCNLVTGTEYRADTKAYKDDKSIAVSDTSSIEECNAVIYYPERRYDFKKIRIMGSAALEVCMVADGTFDCFIDSRGDKGFLRVYDIGAGIHIARLAGAVVTDAEGNGLSEKRIKMDERFKLVVSNKLLHPQLLELV